MSRITAIIVALLFSVVFTGCERAGSGEMVCELLRSIAKDTEKVSYVRSWIAERLDDEAFVATLRGWRSREINDERLRELGGFDWGRLGIKPGLATLELSMGRENAHDNRFTGVYSVSVQQGRNFLVIGMKEPGDLRLTWSEDRLADIELVGNNVYLFCSL